jgi:hypothetical protein
LSIVTGNPVAVLIQREIAPVEARDEQLFAVGIDETGKTDADAFDGAVVIANIFARAIDDLFRSLLGVGTGFKLFLLEHTAG